VLDCPAPLPPALGCLNLADVDGALACLQWVLSARPDAAAAEQQLQAAWKMVRARSSAGVRRHRVRGAHTAACLRQWSNPLCNSGFLQVDPRPGRPGTEVQLSIVGRIAWAGAAAGAQQVAEQCACRAAASQVRAHRWWLNCNAAGEECPPPPGTPDATCPAAAGAGAEGVE
jgi:hypothetical protein